MALDAWSTGAGGPPPRPPPPHIRIGGFHPTKPTHDPRARGRSATARLGPVRVMASRRATRTRLHRCCSPCPSLRRQGEPTSNARGTRTRPRPHPINEPSPVGHPCRPRPCVPAPRRPCVSSRTLSCGCVPWLARHCGRPAFNAATCAHDDSSPSRNYGPKRMPSIFCCSRALCSTNPVFDLMSHQILKK